MCSMWAAVGGGGQLLSGLAIFKQDSIQTAVIISAFHKQGAKTSIVIVNKSIKKTQMNYLLSQTKWEKTTNDFAH